MNKKRLDEQKSLKRLTKPRSHLSQIFFPTQSRIKLHQSQSSTNKTSSLNEQVTKLNQRAIDVRLNLEQNLTSLQTQRLQQLTSLNDKTQDLEKSAVELEYASSKHLKQELDKTRKLSYIFKFATALCLTLFSFMLGYMIVQLIRDKRN